MIKTPLSTVIGGAFWTPGATVIGGNTPTFDQQIQKLFANGEQGFWYDPNDLSTMFQDAAGTIPVTAVGKAVGLILDKSKGLVLSANVISNSNFTSLSGWAPGAFMQAVLVQDGVRISSPTSTTSGQIITTSANHFSWFSQVAIGKRFKITFDAKYVSGAGVLQVGSGFSIGLQINANENGGVFKRYTTEVTGSAGGFSTVATFGATNGSVWVINNVVSQEVIGNHAYQTTSASRPILRQNAVTGANYLEFDGVDDHLLSSLGAVNSDFTTGHACEVLSSLTMAVFSGGLYGYLRAHSGFASVYSSTPNSYPKNKKDVLVQKIANGQHTLTTNLGGGDASSSIEASSTQFWRPYSSTDPKIIGNFSSTHASLAAAMNYYGGFFIAKGMTSLEETTFRNLFNKRMGI